MIENNIVEIRKKIDSICSKTGQDTSSIEMVVVSKGRQVSEIEEALRAGTVNIGENKVQEALFKYNELTNKRANQQTIKWHMVGHLQTNKVKDALRIFDLIHSVDSLRLANQIDKEAAKISKIQDILIEVKTSPEARKFGFSPDDLSVAFSSIAELKHIRVKGLMTIAPMFDDPQEARPYFRTLRELRDKINAIHNTHDTIRILSMGMSDDFEIALQEGSNMIRVGRAIFDGSA